MRNLWRNNSLSIVLFVLFFIFLVGQTLTGWNVYNLDQAEHHESSVTLLSYLTTGHFGEAVFENWESEFLQMSAYIFLTIYLFQKGSAESRDPATARPARTALGGPKNKNALWPVKKGGFILKLYQNSLGLVFVVLFLASLALHGVEGSRQNCQEGVAHGQSCETFKEYVTGSQFWFESFQNWQSEFLAVGGIVVFSIFLLQKDSPESKSVTAPNSTTGS